MNSVYETEHFAGLDDDGTYDELTGEIVGLEDEAIAGANFNTTFFRHVID